MQLGHSHVNHSIIILITIFMGAMLVLTNRSASDIALVGGVMYVLNSGVPINILLDKIIEIRRSK